VTRDPQPRDPQTPDRRQLPFLHLLPNLVTVLGLCAGLTAIRYTFLGQFEIAAGLIILAAVVDGLDGALARRLNAASHFGAELDSLSDFVCFGVAPGLLIFALSLQAMPGFGWLCVLVFIIAACLRLARFNVNRDAPPPPGRAHFVGVPAPAGAMLGLLPVFMTAAELWDLRDWPLLVGPYLAFVGFLMISRLPTISPKGLTLQRKFAPFVLLAMAALAGLVVMRPWTVFVALDVIYLVLLARGAWVQRRRLT
jgi:CDP-diacylglycerol--serine O-phosphatidyltransferase